jgi:hypothetical protein
MRIQISIPIAVWERVQAIAREEYRPPKEQIALFVWEGVQNRDREKSPGVATSVPVTT